MTLRYVKIPTHVSWADFLTVAQAVALDLGSGVNAERVIGRTFEEGFDPDGIRAAADAITAADATAVPSPIPTLDAPLDEAAETVGDDVTLTATMPNDGQTTDSVEFLVNGLVVDTDSTGVGLVYSGVWDTDGLAEDDYDVVTRRNIGDYSATSAVAVVTLSDP
jgi:hypothetical protein